MNRFVILLYRHLWLSLLSVLVIAYGLAEVYAKNAETPSMMLYALIIYLPPLFVAHCLRAAIGPVALHCRRNKRAYKMLLNRQVTLSMIIFVGNSILILFTLAVTIVNFVKFVR